MIRLRLPRLEHLPLEHLPAGVREQLERRAVSPRTHLVITRRAFLRGLAALLAALALPLTRAQRAHAAARGRFLTSAEAKTLAALCDRILPADADPGAKALGAPKYIARLLATRFDRRPPLLYAGGPFSNRNPFPDDGPGTPSARRPRNAFRMGLPLTRLQRLFWQAELDGSASVPEVAALDAQFGAPLVGLRELYRASLEKVDARARAAFGAPFARLSAGQQDQLLAAMDADRVMFPVDPRRGLTFFDVLTRHTLEGCFGVPEYGGNRKGRGWQMLGLEGDSQPLGYSIFSRAAGGYNERADHPMSTPNPDELGPGGTIVPRPIGPEAQQIQDVIVVTSAILENCPAARAGAE